MTDAVLLTFHGTIRDLSDMPAFLAKIRRGRPAPPELLHEVVRRYEAIGGSPLLEISRAQAAALEERLRIPVRVAGRLWEPYPNEALQELSRAGAKRVVSLPLAPQSVHVYHASVREAAAAFPDIEIVEAPSYGLEPRLLDAFVETIEEGLGRAGLLGEGARPRTLVLLTAHSLPLRALAQGDPYERDFRAMADQVAARVEALGYPVRIAFQSQGASAEPWLGPALLDVIAKLPDEGFDRAFVAPIGFVADHVETLYDLDIEARAAASDRGLVAFGRAPTLGARPAFIEAIEAVVRRALATAPSSNR